MPSSQHHCVIAFHGPAGIVRCTADRAIIKFATDQDIIDPGNGAFRQRVGTLLLTQDSDAGDGQPGQCANGKQPQISFVFLLAQFCLLSGNGLLCYIDLARTECHDGS
jgi:hypothetical protein